MTDIRGGGKPCCNQIISMPTNPTWGQAVQLHQNYNFQNLLKDFERYCCICRNFHFLNSPLLRGNFPLSLPILVYNSSSYISLLSFFFLISSFSSFCYNFSFSLPIVGKARLCQNRQMLFLCRDFHHGGNQQMTNGSLHCASLQAFLPLFISDGISSAKKFSSFHHWYSGWWNLPWSVILTDGVFWPQKL